MFSMAQAHDHTSASGNVARPSTPAAGARLSQQTTTPSGASRIPSQVSRRIGIELTRLFQSLGVGHRRSAGAQVGVVDDEKPPGLAVPDRRRGMTGAEHPVQH
jgi:hypothetical protein